MTFDMPPAFPQRPTPHERARLDLAQAVRNDAAQIEHPAIATEINNDERDHEPVWPVQFTKGLSHDPYGIVTSVHYVKFVEAINEASKPGSGSFNVPTGDAAGYQTDHADGPHKFRAWESPRAGHAFDLSAPDGDQVGMAKVPTFGGREAIAEMAEVYGLALLRDVDFADITAAKDSAGPAGTSAKDVIDALNALPYFQSSDAELSAQAATRRNARLNQGETTLTGQSVFRGSGPGTKCGPYLSQFLLAGSKNQEESGLISFGGQTINQRVAVLLPQHNFMGDWKSWLDVQNGADLADHQKATGPVRFMSTPRDLASYVRVDQLYQAYLNAALILLSYKAPFDPLLPTGAHTPTRQSFATFGGPDLLAMLTAVSSPALKAVRRQKFNYHRRGRPERIGGVLTLAQGGEKDRLGLALGAAEETLRQLTDVGLLERISELNVQDLNDAENPIRGRGNPAWMTDSFLLPMAFVEGSPMHPSYGAGHATVAGACVTVLKAFFDMFEGDEYNWTDRSLASIGMEQVFEARSDQSELQTVSVAEPLTINGELNKLAANIAIGRNMAGVHFYTDYFDSLRMGERIAVGMLRERMLSYQEPFAMRFRSFDCDRVKLTSRWNNSGRLEADVEINDSFDAFPGWWHRHI